MKRTVRVTQIVDVTIELPDNRLAEIQREFRVAIWKEATLDEIFEVVAHHVARLGAQGFVEGVGPVCPFWAPQEEVHGLTPVRASCEDQDTEYEHIKQEDHEQRAPLLATPG